MKCPAREACCHQSTSVSNVIILLIAGMETTQMLDMRDRAPVEGNSACIT